MDSDRVALMIKASELYFQHGLDQGAIAKKLGCSPATVSRLLKEARKEGIIEVRIRNPLGRIGELEQRLRETWGLREVAVVRGRYGNEAALKAVANTAAQVVPKWIPPGTAGGISIGKTVFEFTESLQTEVLPWNVEVYSLVGGLTTAAADYQPNEIARRMAEGLGGTWHPLNLPAITSSPQVRHLFEAEPAAKEMMARWASLQWAVVGVGPETRSSHLLSSHEFSPEELEALQRSGAVGDICGRFFDAQGRECTAIAGRLIAVDRETFLRIPLRIGLAGGPSKRRAIRAALVGSWINALVTDELTALELLNGAEGGKLG